jgi:6-phosphogluconolactonase
VDIRVEDDPARSAAELLAGAAEAGGHVALSGGSTPARAYELAALLQPDWSRVHVWFGDERAVPPDDERSNYRLARTTLLDALARPPETHRIRGELPVEEAATLYDEELAGVTLDLAVGGIGPDGHTASLFPHAPSLEADGLAVATEAGLEPFVDRVTLTIPALAAARTVAFLVSGAEKADAARRAFGEAPSPATPASLVRAAEGRTVAILDRAAAAELDLPR